MPHLRANGINLYYEDHGSGEPLILIMGFTVSSIGGMVHQMQAIQGHDTYERLPQTSAPTLVLTGKEDGLVPPENSVTLAQRIPNADL